MSNEPATGTMVESTENGGVVVQNFTDVPTAEIMQSSAMEPILGALVRWAKEVAPPPPSRAGNIFDRDRYVTPTNVFEEMRLAYMAAERDDVVAGVLESTESLAFSAMNMFAEDPDEECVDPETEILTSVGWKRHQELQVGDLVLTLNRETQFSEWQPVEWVVRKPYQGFMYRLVGRNFDALTTPRHRWYVKGSRGSHLREVETADLNTGHHIPYGRPCSNAPDCDLSLPDALVELAGWLVTEGWFERASRTWYLSQSFTKNPANCLRIENALDVLEVDWEISSISADGVRQYRCQGGRTGDWLRKLLPACRLTLDFVRRLSPVQRLLLLDVLVAGDGSPRKGTAASVFYTTDLCQAEACEFLAVQCGRAVTRDIVPPGQISYIRGRAIVSRRSKYVVYVMANQYASVQVMARSKVRYDGLVWCPHTQNGSFLARRNGHIYFTGNSIYNQIAAGLDLDSRLREMWRELFVVSQCVVCIWWDTKTYKVRGKSEAGVRRKKEYTLRAPVGMTLLDPLKVIPVGNLFFGQEQLAYVADAVESRIFDAVLEHRYQDPLLERILVSRYEPTDQDMLWMAPMRVLNIRNLFLLNPAVVWRHTSTRASYQPFATVRMKSVFEILDLKSQLRQMDRVTLIGGSNWILVITKGSDQIPAKPAEIANLQAQVRTVARMPVLIGDHRLHVEIVTPKTDMTLKAERYNTLNSQITSRLYQLLASGAYQSGTTGDDSVKLTKVIARGLESRRHMIRRALEKHLWGPLFAANESLLSEPRLQFHPKNIALDFDTNLASFLLDLRASGELSRETLLSQFDMDQEEEAQLLERERALYDNVFHTVVPHGSPALQPNSGDPQPKPATGPAEQKRQGRQGGGNRNGGGSAPGSGQGQAPRNPRRTST